VEPLACEGRRLFFVRLHGFFFATFAAESLILNFEFNNFEFINFEF